MPAAHVPSGSLRTSGKPPVGRYRRPGACRSLWSQTGTTQPSEVERGGGRSVRRERPPRSVREPRSSSIEAAEERSPHQDFRPERAGNFLRRGGRITAGVCNQNEVECAVAVPRGPDVVGGQLVFVQ